MVQLGQHLSRDRNKHMPTGHDVIEIYKAIQYVKKIIQIKL